MYSSSSSSVTLENTASHAADWNDIILETSLILSGAQLATAVFLLFFVWGTIGYCCISAFIRDQVDIASHVRDDMLWQMLSKP